MYRFLEPDVFCVLKNRHVPTKHYPIRFSHRFSHGTSCTVSSKTKDVRDWIDAAFIEVEQGLIRASSYIFPIHNSSFIELLQVWAIPEFKLEYKLWTKSLAHMHICFKTHISIIMYTFGYLTLLTSNTRALVSVFVHTLSMNMKWTHARIRFQILSVDCIPR